MLRSNFMILRISSRETGLFCPSLIHLPNYFRKFNHPCGLIKGGNFGYNFFLEAHMGRFLWDKNKRQYNRFLFLFLSNFFYLFNWIYRKNHQNYVFSYTRNKFS